MANRHLHIAVVFVWALAHGVWMGAGMHSISDGASRVSVNKGGASLCASCRATSETSGDSLTAKSERCAVCDLSTVLSEAASINIPAVLSAPTKFNDPVAFNDVALSFDSALLPPAHAPPI